MIDLEKLLRFQGMIQRTLHAVYLTAQLPSSAQT